VIATNAPIYRWQRTPESEWLYYLVVVNVSGQVVFQQVLSPATVCTPTECQFTQPTPVADGTYM
jgi:hypothetical protein